MASNDAVGEGEDESRDSLSSGAGPQSNYAGVLSQNLQPPSVDAMLSQAIQAGAQRPVQLPSMSDILAKSYQNPLKQMKSAISPDVSSVLTDSVIQSWRKERRSDPRKRRTARQFLTANADKVTNVKQFTSALAKISSKHSEHELVWRGQGNADWPIRSTLSRAITRSNDSAATEGKLIEAETEILKSVRNWGLGSDEIASIPLHILAELQHAGAPTRLLDVTRDPEIAAWFAVNDESDRDGLLIAWGQHPRARKGVQKSPPIDGLSEPAYDHLFWHHLDDKTRASLSWGTGQRVHVWFPPTPTTRMRVQRGGFLIEAAPMFLDPIRDAINMNLTESTGDNHDWTLSELEQATTVIGLPSPINRKTKHTDPELVPIFTILIKAEAKADICEHLRAHGLDTSTMYPDLPGLVADIRRDYPTS